MAAYSSPTLTLDVTMRIIRWLAVRAGRLGATALLVVGCADRDPVAPSRAAGAPPSFRASHPDHGARAHRARHVVTLAGGERSDFERKIQALGGQVERRHPEIGVVTIRGLSAGAAQALAARADVASVQSDTVLQWIPRPDLMFRQPRNGPAAFGAPQGTNESFAFYFPDQWNMLVIQAPAAWTATPAGNGRLVCVLDTGIDPDHVDLAGRVDLTRSASFVEAEPTIQDFESHGTFVASIVSSNGLGIASVATDARLCAIKVIDATGSGSFADVIAGILFAADEGADAINLSLGAYVDLKERGVRQLVEALQRAVDFARRKGAVVVAAAGNDTINLDRDSHSRLLIPAQLHHVVSVGATAPFNQQHFDMLAGYSNFGGRTGISLVAPGGDFLQGGSEFDLILGACSHTSLLFPCSTSDFLLGAGTSFASPHVAGAVAVVASQLGHKARADRVTDCILRGADDVGPKAIFGAGRLNVANAAACSKPRGSRPLAAAN